MTDVHTASETGSVLQLKESTAYLVHEISGAFAVDPAHFRAFLYARHQTSEGNSDGAYLYSHGDNDGLCGHYWEAPRSPRSRGLLVVLPVYVDHD